jgi:hypothetical protein
VRRTGLDGHAAGDLAHRRQQRQAATGAGDGLVGHAHGAGFDERRGLRRVGCQVQVGVEDLARAQHGAFGGLGLLDLDDHLGPGKHLRAVSTSRGTGQAVLLVRQADGRAGALLHLDLVAVELQLTHAGRRHADAVLVVLDFLGHAECAWGFSWEDVLWVASWLAGRAARFICVKDW